MGTLSSELASVAARVSGQPRVYVDANVPAGLVTFMRTKLRWDVLAVVEHDDLRRAPDVAHFRMARQLQRTLISLDRDYLDDAGLRPRKAPACSCSRRRTKMGSGSCCDARTATCS